ncbi:MAG TPA: DUF5615 family PIN-like protein [Longimicrobiaceae bacterium]|jgi:predicted nuclease of predicted toxin-antitoxin system|nr:DUF5615 family PIN-like protein [Longimicrobiaceae bacterium]
MDYLAPILVDECVTNKVAAMLREAGFTASHVTEIGRRGRSDPQQLAYAAQNGMALLTYNVADFQALHRDWALRGRDHAGILLARDRQYQRNAAGLVHDLRATLNHLADLHGKSEANTEWLRNNVFWITHTVG